MTDRQGLGATDAIEWLQFGLGATFSSSSFTTLQGATGVVSDGGGGWLSRLQQGAPGAYWQVNFTPGDQLLLSYGGVLSVSFDQAVAGVGAQLAYGLAHGAFTGRVSVFDADGNPLEAHSRLGTTNGNADGSAIYLGVLRDQADIARVEFVASHALYADAPAINRLDITTLPAVPEPAIGWLLLLGVPAVAWVRRRENGCAV